MTAPMDDAVQTVEADTMRLLIHGADVSAIEVRIVGGRVPLKVGERVELEVVSIERTVIER